MTVLALDHINITGPMPLLERCRTFYVETLGMHDGPRPPFRSRGFWIYAGDAPLVHLTEQPAGGSNDSAFDHAAFACSGADAVIARLEAQNVAFRLTRVPESQAVQIFLHDPAGVRLELNFANG